MKLHVLSFVLASAAVTSSALKFSVKQAKRPNSSLTGNTLLASNVNAVVSDDNGLDLNTVHDLIYMANVTVGKTVYPVQLDTGSSDLWLKGPSTPLPDTSATTTTYNLTYGIGWAYGHVSYAPVTFAGITVTSQAFLDVSSAQNPALGYGADGILGLGFTSLSTIDALINSTSSDKGRSLLYNLFAENPSESNFLSFALQRSTSDDDDVEGTFTIGEYEPAYKAIADTVEIPTFPVNSPSRWNVLVDALIVGDTIVTPTTEVANAPSNKAVALLDSGTSYTYAPQAICEAIYGGIAGARLDTTLGQWVVPCDAEIDIALQIGGVVYPLHPLDVAPTGLTSSDSCVGSFVPQSVSVGAGEFDWLIGDNVLRAVYSVFDFGDFDSNNVMGNPYVKLLSLIDPDKASAEFAVARNTTAKTGITYNASSSGASSASSVTVSSDVASTLDKIGAYVPAMLGIMALNALVLLGLLILGIVFLCRRRKRNRSSARTPLGRLSPMPMNPRNSYVAGALQPDGPHVYEPVSMAITEDTLFAPPSPNFRKFNGKPGDRPNSVANLPSQSSLYQKIGSEDALFTPPSAAFTSDGRPKSVGILPSQATTYQSQEHGEDQPFTPPAIALHPSGSSESLPVQRGNSPGGVRPDSMAVLPQPSIDLGSPEDMAYTNISPRLQPNGQIGGNVDRPDSGVFPVRSQTHPQEQSVRPPSPTSSVRSGKSQSSLRPNANVGADRPRSAAMPQSILRPPQRSPQRSPPMPPQQSGDFTGFSPPVPAFHRNGGSTLRPNAGQQGGDRPMSVGVLPSQSQYAQQRQHQPVSLRDDGSFAPPMPAFRRNPGGSGSDASGDRPMSIA